MKEIEKPKQGDGRAEWVCKEKDYPNLKHCGDNLYLPWLFTVKRYHRDLKTDLMTSDYVT